MEKGSVQETRQKVQAVQKRRRYQGSNCSYRHKDRRATGSHQRPERTESTDSGDQAVSDWDYIKKLGGTGILRRQDVQDLKNQRSRVLWLMLDGDWHSGQEIVRVAGGTEGLRRLRELREIPNIAIERKRMNERREYLYRLQMKMGFQQELAL